MSTSTLAFGDRLALIRKLIGLVGSLNPEWLDRIAEIIGLFGGNTDGFKKILDVVKQVLEFFKQPTTQSVSDDDAHEKVESLCCAAGITLSELDSVLTILAK